MWIKEILMQNDVKTWELKELVSLTQNLIKRLISICLFHKIKEHNLFSSILNSFIDKLLLVCILVESYWKFTTFGGIFV